ncbi:MAG: SEL1-like repeat protein [Proteobacteria bacterium]|nr:SEL1-like repeat protein [Pseudomonadota bacterium]
MKRIGLALVVFVSMAGWVAYHYDKPEIAVGETISVADIDACKDAYTSQRYSDALQDCRRLAEEGQSRALYLLADMYRNGLGVQKHMGMAATWYRRAAEEGQSRAQYLLADMYRNGLGVQKDTGMAATWYRRAAEQGHTGAQVSLDLMLALDIHSISQMDGGGGPRVCLEFTETLLPIRSSALGDYVRIEPRVKLAASVSGRNLCLSGLSYGQKYGVTIKAGLRGEGGFVVGADRKIDFKVHDREPEITFDTRKYVLPTGVSRGLPVRTVNLDAIDVKLYRVDARMLTQLQPWILGKINGSKFAQLRDDLGELLWRGSVVVENKPNADVTTLLDLASVADVDGPGIYVVAATIPGEGMWRGHAEKRLDLVFEVPYYSSSVSESCVFQTRPPASYQRKCASIE